MPSQLPIYDFSEHGKIGKGVMMDTGLQGLWPLARHLCGTLEKVIDSSVSSSSDFCQSVSIVRFRPRGEQAHGDESDLSSGYHPDRVTDLQNFHALLSPLAPGGGGQFYTCEQLPASLNQFMTVPVLGKGEGSGFGHFFSDSRLQDPASLCQYVPPLAQGAVLSRVGGRVGGLTDARGGPLYFVKISFASAMPKIEQYFREPYGMRVFENIPLPFLLKLIRYSRYFIQLYVKDVFPDKIATLFLRYGYSLSATDRNMEEGDAGLTLLEDLTYCLVRGLKNSEDELVLESTRAILHLLSQRSKYALIERERFRGDYGLNGEVLMHEVIAKYGADETLVDLGCSVLKKLPCLDDSGVLDVEGNTCETKVDACEDFDRQQIAQLTLPGRTKFNEEEFKKCAQGVDSSFGSEDMMNIGRDCLFQNWLQISHETKMQVAFLTESEKRMRIHAEKQEIKQTMDKIYEEERLDEKERFKRKMRGEL